ncbi:MULTISPECIES: helix-turn-helix transcriptional regulator [Parabacteroides]|uniref:helix-turn-helix transcriptional regulator n=2 Tax=Parabacteroides leei TaxID=2939491 RepID=UPI00189B59A7|nr:helix-turn-helix transcriptional regulator [Parabacteroides goldsteinii]
MDDIINLMSGMEQYDSSIFDDQMSIFVNYLNLFSPVIRESLYVYDITQSTFCYLKLNDQILPKNSHEDNYLQEYDFYSKIIFPEDLSLYIEMHKLILLYIKDLSKNTEECDFFSCTFRIQHDYSFNCTKKIPMMVHQRMKYLSKDGVPQYLICSVESSTSKSAGNLCMFNIDGKSYDEYNFVTKRWTKKRKVQLTEREKNILMLAQRGLNAKEIANLLCKGYNTVRNQIKQIFVKLNVHSVSEAIDVANKSSLL